MKGKSSNALIILWHGKELPDNEMSVIASFLVNRGCVESINDVTIVKKDENAIAKSLLATTAVETSFDVIGSKDDVRNEVESAIVYIGKRFEDSLKGTNTTTGLIAFAMNLTAAVTSARNSIDKNQHDYALLNAIEIIKNNCDVINTSAPLAKQYRFTNKVVEVICQTYKG